MSLTAVLDAGSWSDWAIFPHFFHFQRLAERGNNNFPAMVTHTTMLLDFSYLFWLTFSEFGELFLCVYLFLQGSFLLCSILKAQPWGLVKFLPSSFYLPSGSLMLFVFCLCFVECPQI
jgi:hypothetical protein